ncbi:MAG: hypothetical protein EBU46_07685 [Nitrosomonadaceae bacterium]|nr:hypothetical protein [Nitrosomonadaceae bacterium]
MELYYIKDRLTGQYSRGGTGPQWSSKKPKLWTLGALKGHLAQHRFKGIPASWDVYCIDIGAADRQPLMPATAAINYKPPKKK